MFQNRSYVCKTRPKLF